MEELRGEHGRGGGGGGGGTGVVVGGGGRVLVLAGQDLEEREGGRGNVVTQGEVKKFPGPAAKSQLETLDSIMSQFLGLSIQYIKCFRD